MTLCTCYGYVSLQFDIIIIISILCCNLMYITEIMLWYNYRNNLSMSFGDKICIVYMRATLKLNF